MLVSSLVSVPDAGAKTRMTDLSDVGRLSECVSVLSGDLGCYATQTVQTAVPVPTRALRKQDERQQRVHVHAPGAYAGYHSPVRLYSPQSTVLSSYGGGIIMPFHDADYLRFGMLVI